MTAAPNSDLRSRILLIDDDPEIDELVAGILGSDYIELFSALDGDEGVAIARREHPDLILLDYALPGANGLEVLSKLRLAGVPESTPVVFITGNENQKILAACFHAGAADFIRKPFCVPELRARVRSLLDRKRVMNQLERLVLYDPLTSLCNRTSIRSRIQSAINRAQTSHSAVLFLDFDRFKIVNDSLGHDVGDQLLQQVASRLRKSLRSDDGLGVPTFPSTAARLGGDEFVILLEDLSEPKDAFLVADRLLATLADPYSLAGHQVCCSASIGVVENLQSYGAPDEVLRDADTAMYEAKSAGKARYVLFDQTMHDQAQQRLRIENDLRAAVANEEFFLMYQPIVSLETGHTVGFEALIRWQHPERGLIMPAAFLPTAEESRLIVPIGRWMLDRACQDFALWQRTLGDSAPSSIHVNISRKQLLLDITETVGSTLDRHAIAPGCLHVEVAENEIMQTPEVAKATLGELRQLGVMIDMDDFGTGQSSLACLQELPIDVLKIDRSFIANMERSRSFAALVHAVTTLGQNLGLSVVAEGIETADQLVMLQSMECELGQGYYFSRPMPANDVKAFMQRTARPPAGALAACLPQEIACVSAHDRLNPSLSRS